jgi:hypothetical protein
MLTLLLLLLVCEGGTQTSTHHRPCTDYAPHSFTTEHLRAERDEMLALFDKVGVGQKLRDYVMPDLDIVIAVNQNASLPESIKHSERVRSCMTVWYLLRGGWSRLC